MKSQAKRILDLELIHRHKLHLTEPEWQTREALADYSKALADMPEGQSFRSLLPASWAAKRRLSRARKTAEAVVNRSSVHQKWVRQILLEVPKGVPEQILFPELLWDTTTFGNECGRYNNPNRCETCIGEDRPEDQFSYADTGKCGICGQVTEVWDNPHLAMLLAQGKAVYADDGETRINRPIRSSHLEGETSS
ncbi:hypothetical protein PhaeoP83_04468 (plasmid) [Phaeobacter inhibens]|jgi:hypothetical protein|uniref:Uncharacterized protein n=2 Tax=Phaeobacter TaxID=302485 RepID=A0AAN1GVV9_9RHOB|nr:MULTISPECIES: hypothetical protein [Phaeobacter]ATG46058.1 hypothetical protein PhaeoP13_04176 [Phaeobacter piscinae]AUQ52686.1 hypothetical protein PhaeoP83_04468 [Phaeobacter inhibens]AUQ56887.1 hypothetical protein PhaeoP92_04271 [Phaeobacter inhibens]AUQ68867.1 hypothetical protein PhaeoP78_04051 [Phaeobacter inhibens]AUQ80904.1 hypothetical protein PhaeoP74_04273 [Phaeobacter inhibens]